MIVICEQVGVAGASRDPFRISGKSKKNELSCSRDFAVTLSARLPAGMIAIKRRMMPVACRCLCKLSFFVDFVSYVQRNLFFKN